VQNLPGMDFPARPRDALAQPTRARLFSLIAELRRPVGTDELAQRLGLHPNGVRVHLERLLQDGLIARKRRPQERGRPRDVWTIAPGAHPGGDPPTGYGDLGRWLARVLSTRRASVRQAEVTGRQIGHELAPESDGRSEDSLFAVFAALGFAPRREADGPQTRTYRLCNCPYRDAVRESPDVVCALHRGITRGVLDVIAPKTKLAAFVPSDPDLAGCLIEIHGSGWASGQ
jgi:predicted ArsR family transcriptional regulator